MALLESMISEAERVKSFKYWPYKEGSCVPAKMAEAGFYSSGKKSDADLAKCYVCLKELDGWEMDDDPWVEHRKHAEKCAYVQLGKKPSELTVRDIYDLELERMKNHIYKKFEKEKSRLLEMKAVVGAELDRVKSTEKKDTKKGPARGRRIKC